MRNQAASALAAAQAQAANIAVGSRPADRAVIGAQQRQAAAALALAQIERARLARLVARGAVSRDALDQAQATETVDAARLRASRCLAQCR